MAYTEPPPVYSSLSSLSEDDKIYFRAEEKKKSLWLSPFTARREPKKFALFHLTASSILFIIAVLYAYFINVLPNYSGHYHVFGRDGSAFIMSVVLFLCVPPLPLFLSALVGIKKSRPNFLLPIAIYMFIAFVLLALQMALILVLIVCAFFNFHGWMLFVSWITFGSLVIPLLYTSHAARLYLRVRVDILEEKKQRQEEKKVPLIF